MINPILKAQFLASGRKKVKKPAIWLFPWGAEREYSRELIQRQNIFDGLIERIILSQVDSLVLESRQFRPDSNIKLDFVDRIEELIAALTFTFRNSIFDVRRLVTNQAQRISSFNNQQFNKVIQSSLGVNPFLSEPFLLNQIRAFVDQNSSLITNITDEQTRRIKELLLRDLSAGLGSAEIEEGIRKIGKFGKNRARLIARDQTAKFNDNLSELRMLNVGIEEYTWLTARDDRVRPTHRRNDGKIFRNDTPPPTTGHPGHDVNCRCTRQPVITDELFN
ncbi:MAG: minor capsid protein [Candidatus Thorarchaeota archaeon]